MSAQNGGIFVKDSQLGYYAYTHTAFTKFESFRCDEAKIKGALHEQNRTMFHYIGCQCTDLCEESYLVYKTRTVEASFL
jgi:hypothetical protein